jgi:hypothetical protein
MERGPATNPLFGAFLQAVQEAGYPLTDDVNGFRQEGFAKFDRNVYRGRRLSAAGAYLHPVMSRKNLDVLTNALVTGVVFEGTRAVGVEYKRFGRGVGAPRGGGRGRAGGRCHQLTAAAAAVRGGRPDAAARPGHPGGRRRARCGREPPGPPGGLRAARVHAAGVDAALPREEHWAGVGRGGCSCAAGPAPPTTSRRAASSAATTTSTTRTSCSTSCRSRCATTAPRPRAGTATRCTSGRCTPTPAAP